MSYLKCVKVNAAAQAAGELLGEALLAGRRKPKCPCGAAAKRTVVKVERLGPTLAIDLHLRCGRCARALKAATEALVASVAPVGSSDAKATRSLDGDRATRDDAQELGGRYAEFGSSSGNVVSLA